MSQVDIMQYLANTNMGEYAQQVAETAQFPPQTTALISLGVASQVASLAVSVAYSNGKPMPTGLICVGEQPSGSAKSRVLDSFRRHFEDVIKTSNETKIKKRAEIDGRLKNEKREMMESERSEYDRSCPLSIGLKSATIEAVEQVAFRQGGFFALASSEKGLINTLLGLSYGDKSKPSCDDLILNGYDGDNYEVGRVNADRNGAGYVYGSMSIIAQDGVIDSLVDKSSGSGLAERVMFIVERNIMGCRDWSKILQPTNRERLEELEIRYNNRVSDILDIAFNRDSMEMSTLFKLKISNGSWGLIAEYMNDNEHRVGFKGQYENSVLSGAYSKKVPNIMKVAATLYLFEVDTQGEGLASYIKNNRSIPQWCIEKAICIVDATFNGMVALCETKGISGADREVETVCAYLCKQKGKQFKESELKRALKNTHPFKTMSTEDRNNAIMSAVNKAVIMNEIGSATHGLSVSYFAR